MPVLFQHLSERLIKYAPQTTSSEWSNTDLAYIMSRGTMGVYLFFVLSGFILCIPFAKSFLNDKQNISYSDYIVRRISRLEPPYIIWMLFFFIVLILSGRLGFFEGLSHYLASIFYIHNFWFNEYSTINPVAWSLEVEFQFYLLAPIIAFIYFKTTNVNFRRCSIIFLILMSPIIQALFGFNQMPWKASFLGQAQHFFLGFLLADLFLTNKSFFKQKIFAWDIVAIISFGCMLITWSNEWHKEIIFSICSAFFFVSAFKGKTLNNLLNKPTIFLIGGMCYTIYLMHLPLFEFVVSKTSFLIHTGDYALSLLIYTITLIPITLFLSAIFFLLLEKPFMKKNWWQRKSTEQLKIEYDKNQFIYYLKKMRKTILITSTILLISQNIASQESLLLKQSDIAFDQDKWTDQMDYLKLLSTEELVNKAIMSSPLISSQEIKIDNHENDIKLLNRRWLDYLTVGGTYFYGSSSFLDAVETIGITDYSVTNRKNAIANAHVSARIPISEIFTRQPEKDKLLNEIALEELKKKVLENTIRATITKEYQTVLAKTSMLKIKSKELQSLRLAAKLAEEYLLQGDIELDEYTAAISKLAKAELEFSSLQHEAQSAYSNLQIIVGQPIEEGR